MRTKVGSLIICFIVAIVLCFNVHTAFSYSGPRNIQCDPDQWDCSKKKPETPLIPAAAPVVVAAKETEKEVVVVDNSDLLNSINASISGISNSIVLFKDEVSKAIEALSSEIKRTNKGLGALDKRVGEVEKEVKKTRDHAKDAKYFAERAKFRAGEAKGFRNEAKGYRDETARLAAATEGFRDEAGVSAEAAKDSETKAAEKAAEAEKARDEAVESAKSISGYAKKILIVGGLLAILFICFVIGLIIRLFRWILAWGKGRKKPTTKKRPARKPEGDSRGGDPPLGDGFGKDDFDKP